MANNWPIVTDMNLNRALALLSLLLLSPIATLAAGDTARPKEKESTPALIKPPIPTGTGLLLQPPLDLAAFTREEFDRLSSSVGPEKIHKKWTSPVTTLPPHPRKEVHGLTEPEVKSYMLEVVRLFETGGSVPVSDAGLISTQEDVIRRPMLNHIAAFSNAVTRVYLLVQKTSTDKGWSYFSIVQDLTIEPVADYFAQVTAPEVKFESLSCSKCHSSGPLAIHPTRADLVNDPELAAAISKHIAEQPRSRMRWPETEKQPDYGKPMTLKFCSRCHSDDGDRGPLFKAQSHPIRVLVDFGYMPPNRALKPEEIAELKAWLDQKP